MLFSDLYDKLDDYTSLSVNRLNAADFDTDKPTSECLYTGCKNDFPFLLAYVMGYSVYKVYSGSYGGVCVDVIGGEET